MSSLRIYTLSRCSTCREALRWLAARGITPEVRAIRETPPTVPELRAVLSAPGGAWQRLFNRSGMEYRALGLAGKLPAMTEADALALLASNGRLVKRPLLVGRGVGLVGFDPVAWARALPARMGEKPESV